jgi:diacylglycerol O-acyltransferase / wax synthase
MAEREKWFERLSALDATFLDIETDATPMHLGAVAVFDGGGLTLPHGGIDFARVRDYIASRLPHSRRYLQRIARAPGFGHPSWVDDVAFELDYHVRHTRLPAPGGEEQLKALVGQVFSERLDVERPLWEMWVVEGLEGGKFALVIKAHHCMMDGIAGVGFMASLLRPTPDDLIDAPPPYRPRPNPGGRDLLRAELEQRVRGAKMRQVLLSRLREHRRGLVRVLRTAFTPASKTSLNPKHVRAHRRFDWFGCSLEAAKGVKQALGGTVNDVVLATTAGALRRYLERRGDPIDELARFRALLPVNLLGSDARTAPGNHVALLLCELPILEPDPKTRYARIVERTSYLKGRSDQARAAEVLEDIANVTSRSLVAEMFRHVTRLRPYNVVVTNVPGPQVPLYLLGARLRAVYPMVPLFGNQALGVAIMSYAGSLYFGLHAAFSEARDVDRLAGDLEASFEELRRAAEAQSGAGSRLSPMR